MPKLPGEFEKGKRIGAGKHKNVYGVENSPGEVMKVLNPDRGPDTKDHGILWVKGYFYLNNLCHLLFKDLVPKIHMVTKKGPGRGLEVAIEELVEHDEYQMAYQRELHGGRLLKKELADKKYKEIQAQKVRFERLFELINFNHDISWQNFITSSDGNLKYIEGMEPWIRSYKDGVFTRLYNRELFEEEIVQLPEPDRTRAQNYLNRLEELFAQAQKEATHS